MGIYWTIQSAGKWEEIQEKGVLTASPDFIWPEDLQAYNWIREKMNEKIPDCHEQYPVWLWMERPDLRKTGHLEAGEKGVLLKINIEDQRVLLSDFQAWHFVLNNWYFDIDGSQMDESQLSQSVIEKSWELIFDIDHLMQHPDWGENVCTVQGVTNSIGLNEMTFVKEFIAR